MPVAGPERHAGHRGHKGDPLYRCRRLLTKADERLDDKGRENSSDSSTPAIPEARFAWPGTRKKSFARLRPHRPVLAAEFVERLGHDLQDETCLIEIRRVGRTLLRWKGQIVN